MSRAPRPSTAVVPRGGPGAPAREGDALNWKVVLALAAGFGALGLMTWIRFQQTREIRRKTEAAARKTKAGKAKAKGKATAAKVMREPTKQQDTAIKALLQQARKQQTAGQYEESEATYRQLKELVLQAYGKESRPYLNTLQLLTSVLISQDMYESAVEVQLEMLELAKSLSREQGGGPELTAELYTSIGDSYIRLDRIDEAFPYCERSVAEFSRFRNPPPENAGVAWWNLAIAHGRRSNYEEAEKACKQALKTLSKQQLAEDEPYNQLIVCVQLTYSTILSDSNRPAEAAKMIEQVLSTLATGKVQQAVVFIRLLARTRFERGLYADAESYLARADSMLLGESVPDPRERSTLQAYIMCDRLAILRESGKAAEADALEAELTAKVKKDGLPVPLAQSKFIRVRDALLPRSTGGYRLDVQLRPVVPYTKDGKLHLVPGNHFVVKFQNPSEDKPLVVEHTLTKEDCRKRLLQFKSPKGGLAFVPGEVYTAEVLVYDNAGAQTLISRVLQLFCRKDRAEDA